MSQSQCLFVRNIPDFLEIFFIRNNQEDGFFWLDSGNGEYSYHSKGTGGMGRFAFWGMYPEQRWKYFSSGKLQVLGNGKVQYCNAVESLNYLEKLAQQYSTTSHYTADGCGIPLQAGLVGSFSYELGYYLHSYFLPYRLERLTIEENLLWEFAAYPAVLVLDLKLQHLHFVGQAHSRALELLSYKALEAIRYSEGKTAQNFQRAENQDETSVSPNFLPLFTSLRSEYSFQEYRQKFLQVKEYLRQGEVYQLNFSQKLQLSAELRESGSNNNWDNYLCHLYLRLRREHPVPFGGFYRLADGQSILSFSPECFFRFRLMAEEGRIEVRPMKGTRPRGPKHKQKSKDQKAYDELCTSTKDRAELLMIADLLRNDLYRICQPQSVQIYEEIPESKPFCIEKYPSVWQQTAAISGKLKPEIMRVGLLGRLWPALFPCGSITGAPKMRAMALLQELELNPRQWYTGNLGYINCSGNMEFNVLIRSFYAKRDFELDYHVGSGLVWDSELLAEWNELEVKCQFFLRALNLHFPDSKS